MSEAFITLDGAPVRLRLTLGALAEIEAAFGGDVEALADRLKRPRIGDILVILRALIDAGGSGVSLDALKSADLDIKDAAAAVARVFAALGEGAPEKPEATGAGGTPSSPESSS